jgi:hypothetical protein
MQLVDLPEEILFLILEYAILSSNPSSFKPRLPPFLACRTIYRIGLPILYRNLFISRPHTADLIQRTLLEDPTLVRHVRNIYSTAKTAQSLQVLGAVGLAKGSLQTLDFSLDLSLSFPRIEGNIADLFAAVPIRRLAVRQTSSYLRRHYGLAAADALAQAVEYWPNLVCFLRRMFSVSSSETTNIEDRKS